LHFKFSIINFLKKKTAAVFNNGQLFFILHSKTKGVFMNNKIIAIGISTLFFLSLFSFAQEKEEKFKYVGSKKCKTCHNAEKNGAQYKIWSTKKHANAYETLKTEEAKAKAAKLGVKDPLTSDQCTACHAPGFGKKNVDKSFSHEEGVGCETCHGPGSEYKKMKTMKDRKLSVVAGMIKPDEKLCKTCHKKDTPEHKISFTSFEKEFAKIAHPVPPENDRRIKK
jgi:hypothetical protein